MKKVGSVLYLGSPFWCRYLAALIPRYSDYAAFTARQGLRWLFGRKKVICLVGLGPPDSGKRRLYHLFAYVLEKTGLVRKRMIYWIGSDVQRLTPGSRFVGGSENVAGSRWLAEEVESLGYRCGVSLFPVELSVRDSLAFPTSGKLNVLCYVPDNHFELHGGPEIREVASQLPDVNFVIIGGQGSWWPNHPANVRFTGWIEDSKSYLEESQVVLRRTSHDSFSAFVREGIVSKRYVFFTYKVAGATHVARGAVDELSRQLRDLRDRLAREELAPNDVDPVIIQQLSDVESQVADLAKQYG